MCSWRYVGVGSLSISNSLNGNVLWILFPIEIISGLSIKTFETGRCNTAVMIKNCLNPLIQTFNKINIMFSHYYDSKPISCKTKFARRSAHPAFFHLMLGICLQHPNNALILSLSIIPWKRKCILENISAFDIHPLSFSYYRKRQFQSC